MTTKFLDNKFCTFKIVLSCHEDANGEKLTVKKWWIFGADFSRFTQSFSRFIRDINGEKNISLLMIFFSRLVFHGLPPLDRGVSHEKNVVFFDNRPLCHQGPTPSKAQLLFLLSSRRL